MGRLMPMWLPGRPLLSSTEAFALDDLTPPPPPVHDPWTTTKGLAR